MAVIPSLIRADTHKDVETQAPAIALTGKSLRSSATLADSSKAQVTKASVSISTEKQVHLAGIGGAPEVADKSDGTKPLASFIIVIGAPIVLIPLMVYLKTGSLEKLM